MTTQIKRRRGTTTEHSTFTGAEGEITIDTTKDTVVVHDGSTAGGHPLAKESSIAGKVDSSGDTMTGDLTVPNIIVSGNVDGRDVSADGTKLDGIEAGADVTDTANVTAAGAAMETGADFTGNVTFGDNDKAIFGAGSDLQIYHDGSYSYIDEVGTNDLVIRGSNNILIQRADGTETLAKFTTDGACEFRYDNATKLATTSTGVDITGTLTSDGLLVEGEVAGQGASIEAHATVTEFGDALLIARSDNASNNLHAGVKVQGSSNPFYIYQTNGANTNKLRFNYNAMSDAGGQMTIDNNGDISFYEGTGTTPKFFWDASAERLGIGTSLPDYPLHVKGGTNILKLETTTNGRTQLGGYDSAGNANFVVGSADSTNAEFWNYKNGYLRFATNSTERMRIDSSGNLLVGTTTEASDDVGHALLADGAAYHTANNRYVGLFNRKSSDGELIQFRKDNSTVGSIGTASSYIYIANGDTGIAPVGGTDRLLPVNGSGAVRDAAIDMGYSSGRFKDLYLSGGVYLGGTGSANKLDGYEEGTWTPAYSTSGGSFTYDSATQGQYTKIGNVVTVYFRIYTLSATVGSGDVTITGLPFAEAIPSGTSGGSIGDCREFVGDTPSEISVNGSSIFIWYRTSSNGGNTRLQASDLGTGSVDNLIDGQITYITS